MSKIIGYCRVSTKGQVDGNSLEEQSNKILERYSNSEIIEESYSGVKERPIFNKVLDSLNDGDTLVVTKLDRFCRTTKEGLEYIDSLMNKGVKIHILNMGLIEDTPMGRLIVTNLLAFAEFERAMIIERTQSGKAIAKTKEGFKEGRPKAYTEKQLDNALGMLSINGGNYSYNEVSDLLGISKSTLIREVNSRKCINSVIDEIMKIISNLPKGEFELNRIYPSWDIIARGDKIRIGKCFKNEVISGRVPQVRSIGTIKNDRHEWYKKL